MEETPTTEPAVLLDLDMAGGDLETFHAMLDRAPDDRRRLFERFIFRRGARIR